MTLHKKHIKILVLLFVLQFNVNCSGLLFTSNLLNTGFLDSSALNNGDSGVDDGLLGNSDASDASLMQDGPLPIPVTMSKLDGVDGSRLTIVSEVYDAQTSSWSVLRQAWAQGQFCEIGSLCRVTVRGLAGAVRNPELTGFVLLYADDDNALVTEVNAQGGFDAQSIIVNMVEETQSTQSLTIQAITREDWTSSSSHGTFPLFFVVTTDGTVQFLVTNTNGDFITDVTYVDSEGQIYYVVQNDDSSYDLWRQDLSGSMPILILNNAPDEIGDITVFDENTIVVYFTTGSVQTVTIDSSGSAQNQMTAFVRQALARDFNGARTVADGSLVYDPVTVSRFDRFMDSVEVHPFLDQGLLVFVDPDRAEAQGSELAGVTYLVAFLNFDGELTTIVPRQASQDTPDGLPSRVQYLFTNNMLYLFSRINDEGQNHHIEFSKLSYSPQGEFSAWADREVMVEDIDFNLSAVSARDDMLIISAYNSSNELEFLAWNDEAREFITIWNENEALGLADNLHVMPGVVISPDKKVVLACAVEFEDGEQFLSEEEREQIFQTRGLTVLAHRVGLDGENEFNEILSGVSYASSCENHLFMSDSRLYYYGLTTDVFNSQLSYVELYTQSFFKDFIYGN